MDTHRIVVIGAAGGMARVGLQRLSSIRDDLIFELYDLDMDRLEDVATTLPRDRVTTGRVDLFDPPELRRVLDGASLVVLGAGPYLRTAPPVMRACIEAGVDYIDFDDDVESTLDGLELDNQARAAGVGLFLGCGASPGLSNVMAVDAAKQLDRVETVDVCWVSGDEGPYPFGAAVLEHAIHISAGDTLIWREGREVAVPTFVENEVFPMGGDLGDYRLYLTGHPEAVTLPRFFSGVRSVRVMGGLHPQPVNGVIRGVSLAVKDGKLTLTEAVKWFQAVMQDQSGSLKVWRHALAGMLGQVRRDEATLGEMGSYLWQGLRKHHVPFLAGILVRATGARNGEPATVIRRTSTGGPGSFLGSSMANATGTCLAAFAHLALDQKEQLAGALSPEDWVVSEHYYSTLEGLGVSRDELFGGEPAADNVAIKG